MSQFDHVIESNFGKVFFPFAVTVEGTGNGNDVVVKFLASLDWWGDNNIFHLGKADNEADIDGAGNTVYAGAGNDSVEIFGNDNIVFLGVGDDFVKAETSFGGRSTAYGGSGNDVLSGGAASDYFRGGSGHDNLFGGSGNDTLRGGSGNDYFTGGSGDDRLRGGKGDDVMYGSTGNDTLRGGDGDDVLGDDEGDNVLIGGSGNDTFVFYAFEAGTGVTTIADFGEGDSIEVSAYDGTEIGLQQNGNDVLLQADGAAIAIIENSTVEMVDEGLWTYFWYDDPMKG